MKLGIFFNCFYCIFSLLTRNSTCFFLPRSLLLPSMTVNEIEISIHSTIGPQISVPNVEYLLCNLVLKGIIQRKYSEEYGTG